MKKILFILLFYITYSGVSMANPKLPEKLIRFYNKYNDALNEYNEKHYQNALNFATEAASIWKETPEVIDLFIRCYLKLHNNSQAKKWMAYTIEHFYRNVSELSAIYLIEKNSYGLNENSPIIKELKGKEKELQNKFLTPENRKLLSKYEEASRCHTFIDSTFKLSGFVDSLNITKIDFRYKNQTKGFITGECILPAIEFILDKTIFPDESEIGDHLLLDLIMIKYPIPNMLSVMDTALYLGKMNPWEYAYIYDRCIETNYYGTKYAKDNKNQIVLDAIPKVEKVDSRRVSIGLRPIYIESKYSDYKLSDEYKSTLPK